MSSHNSEETKSFPANSLNWGLKHKATAALTLNKFSRLKSGSYSTWDLEEKVVQTDLKPQGIEFLLLFLLFRFYGMKLESAENVLFLHKDIFQKLFLPVFLI